MHFSALQGKYRDYAYPLEILLQLDFPGFKQAGVLVFDVL